MHGQEVAENNASDQQPSRHDCVYYFQHKLLPRWTHQSDGQFYEDMRDGIPPQLLEAASKIVGKEFADSISIQALEETDGIFIHFAEPQEVPECYYVIILKSEEGFEFFTLEKALDFMNEGYISVVAMWTDDGSHLNLGSYKFSDAQTFKQHVIELHQGE